MPGYCSLPASIIFILAPHSYSRFLFGYFLVMSFLLITLCKIGIKVLLHLIRGKGYNFRNILIISAGQNALKMCKMIAAHRHWGLNVSEYCFQRQPDAGQA